MVLGDVGVQYVIGVGPTDATNATRNGGKSDGNSSGGGVKGPSGDGASRITNTSTEGGEGEEKEGGISVVNATVRFAPGSLYVPGESFRQHTACKH